MSISAESGHVSDPVIADADVAASLIAAEEAALRRWGDGDPDGFLELCDPEVTYFDPFLDMRLDGLPALRSYYDQLRGQIHIDRFELVNPVVVAGRDLAVLTFNFHSTGGNDTHRWNCTEVYRKAGTRWLIVQTHWSIVRPGVAFMP
jgi:hypothetical protein